MTPLLAVVPARAGSKGVPGKNTARIAGRPLVDFTVAALERSLSVGAILLTTDDREIIDLYVNRKSIFLIERPAELATDTATTSDGRRACASIMGSSWTQSSPGTFTGPADDAAQNSRRYRCCLSTLPGFRRAIGDQRLSGRRHAPS